MRRNRFRRKVWVLVLDTLYLRHLLNIQVELLRRKMDVHIRASEDIYIHTHIPHTHRMGQK